MKTKFIKLSILFSLSPLTYADWLNPSSAGDFGGNPSYNADPSWEARTGWNTNLTPNIDKEPTPHLILPPSEASQKHIQKMFENIENSSVSSQADEYNEFSTPGWSEEIFDEIAPDWFEQYPNPSGGGTSSYHEKNISIAKIYSYTIGKNKFKAEI